MPTKPVDGSCTLHTLASAISKQMPHVYRNDIYRGIVAIFKEIEDRITQDNEVNVVGFGTFNSTYRKSNLFEGYTAHHIFFRPSIALRRKLNNGEWPPIDADSN
jgi:hypothetical protein